MDGACGPVITRPDTYTQHARSGDATALAIGDGIAPPTDAAAVVERGHAWREARYSTHVVMGALGGACRCTYMRACMYAHVCINKRAHVCIHVLACREGPISDSLLSVYIGGGGCHAIGLHSLTLIPPMYTQTRLPLKKGCSPLCRWRRRQRARE